MGTSNWQQIPFCIEVMMKIAPQRVLDVGVGFGRWGIVTREFCDVWFSRVLRPDWKVHIEGVEAFPKNIDVYHRFFYDKIHIGDVRKCLPQLNTSWNLIIFGDVIEHFEKPDAIGLLKWALGVSDYVLVNIPLGTDWAQAEKYENPFERHLSEWTADDFAPFSLRRQAFFQDYIDRPSGSFVLSQNDPRGLAHQLFSRCTTAVDEGTPTSLCLGPANFTTADRLTGQIQALTFDLRARNQELEAIKRSLGYRIVNRLRSSWAFPLLHRTVHVLVNARTRLLLQRQKCLSVSPLGGGSPGASSARYTPPHGIHNRPE